MPVSLLQPFNQPGNRQRLIPLRPELADQMKPAHCLPPRRRILSQFPGADKQAKMPRPRSGNASNVRQEPANRRGSSQDYPGRALISRIRAMLNVLSSRRARQYARSPVKDRPLNSMSPTKSKRIRSSRAPVSFLKETSETWEESHLFWCWTIFPYFTKFAFCLY